MFITMSNAILRRYGPIIMFILYRYISNPTGEPISPTFLENGNYEIEVMGKKYDAKMTLKSPLDPNDKRVEGIYDEPLPVRL